MTTLVTDGASFIGNKFVRDWLTQSDETDLNLDALTCLGLDHNKKKQDPTE